MKKITVFGFFIAILSINTAFCMESYNGAMSVPLKIKPYTYNSIDLLGKDAAQLKRLLEKDKKGLYSRRLCAAGLTLGTLLDQQKNFGINIEKMFGVEAVKLAQLVVEKEKIKNELYNLVLGFCHSQPTKLSPNVWKKFREINQEFPDVLNAHYPEINGATLMHRLAMVPNDDGLFSVIMFTCNNVNPNVVDKQGNTLLHVALMSGITSTRTIKSLLKHKKIDLALSNKYGEFPLDIACKYNDGHWGCIMGEALQGQLIGELSQPENHECEKVAQLLRAGADARSGVHVYVCESWFVVGPPLCEALKKKCKHCIALLVEKLNKKDINEAISFQCYDGTLYEQSPLCKAIIAELSEEVQSCLSAETARVKETYGSLESTPLLLAAISGCIDSVKILLEHGALVKRDILSCPWIDNGQIIELLTSKYKEQACLICCNNQDELKCSLEYMPCASHHPDAFLCAQCYDQLGCNEYYKPCPMCTSRLQIYPSTLKIYQSWH